MNKSFTSIYKLSASTCLIALCLTMPVKVMGIQKLQPEEIVAKHLESIAAAETRASVKTVLAGGTAIATFRSPKTAQLTGQVVIASAGNKNMVGMIFENSTAAQEKFGFDGNEVTTSYVRPGMRSSLGDFLSTHKVVLKQGLLGGVLSTSWPLLDLAERGGKLEFSGTKKIGGRPAYELKYQPRGGSDLEIKLFFDAENFHHLRTEYSRVITAQMGASIDASGAQRQTRYKMVEDFSDFKKVGSLTMPHSYKLMLELETRNGTYNAEWKLNLVAFSYNQPIPANSFVAANQ